MTPKFLITSKPHRTVLELILEHDTGPDAPPDTIVDSLVFKPSASLATLRLELVQMWHRWHFASASETQPIPPLPPIQWTHQR